MPRPKLRETRFVPKTRLAAQIDYVLRSTGQTLTDAARSIGIAPQYLNALHKGERKTLGRYGTQDVENTKRRLAEWLGEEPWYIDLLSGRLPVGYIFHGVTELQDGTLHAELIPGDFDDWADQYQTEMDADFPPTSRYKRKEDNDQVAQ
jgi:hypothetical protein